MLHAHNPAHDDNCPCQERERLIHECENVANQIILEQDAGNTIVIPALNKKLEYIRALVRMLNDSE